MPNQGNPWKADEIGALKKAWKEKPDWVNGQDFAATFGKNYKRTIPAVYEQVKRMIRTGELEKQYVKQSPYPVYDSPLVMEGDALVLPDLEIPFHNAEFINRVLDLAEAWKIDQCILAGDVLHFDSLSGWSPSWANEMNGGITADAEARLMEFAKTLTPKKQGELFGLMGEIGERTEHDGVSTELGVARKVLRGIADLFPTVHFLLGNHEGRLLRALETAVSAEELLRLLSQENWCIAPYYFSYLDTNRGRFQIEHPKGYSEGTAQQLAAKYGCHIIMGHSHLLDFTWDISGRYHAIHAGHCVDEARLPYAAQRHTTRRAHKPGAVIVRDGFPWILFEGVPWERYKHA